MAIKSTMSTVILTSQFFWSKSRPSQISQKWTYENCRPLFRADLSIGRDDISVPTNSALTPKDKMVFKYRVAQKKRPELSHGVMQHSRWSESAEKHVCNEQTSSNVSIKFHLKRFHISRCTREIVLHVIKQCYTSSSSFMLLAVRRLHQNVTVIGISQLISRKCAE